MFTTGMLGESKITPYRRSGEKKNLIVLWYYFVEEWYRAATLLVFPLARTEGATLELIRELLYHARGKPKSRLKVFHSRPLYQGIDARFYDPTQFTPLFPPLGGILRSTV